MAKKSSKARNSANLLANKFKGLEWAGEIVTWNARSDQDQTHATVVAALKNADLDEEVAKELLPRHAFARASKKLSEERVIDIVRDGAKQIIFQFTRKALQGEGDKREWKYARETYLRLDKATGHIECDVDTLREKAQQALNQAIETRTTSDITRIVQRQFERHADLFPLRDQGGVYFVPREHTAFTAKVETFLSELGGHITRIPVPAGTGNGDIAIQDAVANGIKGLVSDHNQAVEEFTINTRKDTIERAAERISETRVKVEAYAQYLAGEAKSLLREVDEANAKLAAKVEELSGMGSDDTTTRVRQELHGHTITAVIRWMGLDGWTFKEATRALEAEGINVAPATIRAQLLAGARGERGEPAVLNKSQAAKLRKARKESGK